MLNGGWLQSTKLPASNSAGSKHIIPTLSGRRKGGDGVTAGIGKWQRKERRTTTYAGNGDLSEEEVT